MFTFVPAACAPSAESYVNTGRLLSLISTPVWLQLLRYCCVWLGMFLLQMSVVLLDVLRHKYVHGHSCLTGTGDNFCGLAPSHPANIGQMLYTFSDPKLNLVGRSTQTLTGGICLDGQCGNLTTVALHDGDCTYAAEQKADGNPGSLLSLVSALTSVELVSNATMNATSGGRVLHYGIVLRDNKRIWEADGFRGVRYERVCPDVESCVSAMLFLFFLSSCSARLTPHLLWAVDWNFVSFVCFFWRCACHCLPRSLPLQFARPVRTTQACDMSQWDTSVRPTAAPKDKDLAPHNCDGSGGVDVSNGSSFTKASRIVHIRDSNPQGSVGKMCSGLATILRRSASTLGSTQDVVASGLREAAFLSPKPPLVSQTEAVLAIVTAAQGVVVAIVLLFVEAEEWGLLISRLFRRLFRQRPPPQVPAADTSLGERLGRLVGLLLLSVGLTVYVDVLLLNDVRQADGDSSRRVWLRACSRRSNSRSSGCLLLLCAPPTCLTVLCVGLFLFSVEFLPLGIAHASEAEAKGWEGVFAHVDLAVIAPGANNDNIACSTGVPFVVISLLGQARYIDTVWQRLDRWFWALGTVAGVLHVARVCQWAFKSRAPQEEGEPMPSMEQGATDPDSSGMGPVNEPQPVPAAPQPVAAADRGPPRGRRRRR